MPSFLSSVGLVLALAAAAACSKKNPYYCEGAPRDNCVLADGGGPPCTENEDCAAPTPVCDTQADRCVQCIEGSDEGACEGETPVCSGTQCVACVKHDDCDSKACLPDGSCASEAEVAYVDSAAPDNPMCSLNMTCRTVGAALATNRPYVKLTGTTDEAVVVDNGRKVTFFADMGAKLTRTTGTGAILTASGDGTALTVYDLSISDGPNNPSGIGVVVPAGMGAPAVALHRTTIANNRGAGVSIGGGSLKLTQSTIAGNTGGGVVVTNATFAIVGNVFFNNGGDPSIAGGASISTSQDSANVLEFNSFHANKAMSPFGAGLNCVAGTFTARNNIISDNGTLSNMLQITGSCAHRHSIVRPGSVPGGEGNIGDNPLFANPSTGNLHIAPTSPARRAADPATALTELNKRDIDNQLRPDPQGGMTDIGADQVP